MKTDLNTLREISNWLKEHKSLGIGTVVIDNAIAEIEELRSELIDRCSGGRGSPFFVDEDGKLRRPE